MFCKNCKEGNSNRKGKQENVAFIKMPGINQCQSCGCGINRVGLPVIPAGKYPLTRKERILDRPYRRF